jgi:hypothetical protein
MHIKGTRPPGCEGVAMDACKDSLGAQHAALELEADKLADAGRRGRWAEYRLRLGNLREGLLLHMGFEDEALLPVLESGAAAAVAALREEHAELRRRLEMLGAAAPEQDPRGCVAEIEELARHMRAHHAAEMALDPRYATRAVPDLGLEEEPPLDLRGLQPPEPLVRIFSALERDPDAPLRVILPHEPLPLYGLLRERGYGYAGSARADGGFEVLIERRASG